MSFGNPRHILRSSALHLTHLCRKSKLVPRIPVEFPLLFHATLGTACSKTLNPLKGGGFPAEFRITARGGTEKRRRHRAHTGPFLIAAAPWSIQISSLVHLSRRRIGVEHAFSGYTDLTPMAAANSCVGHFTDIFKLPRRYPVEAQCKRISK